MKNLFIVLFFLFSVVDAVAQDFETYPSNGKTVTRKVVVPEVTQAEAEAGIETDLRKWSPVKVKAAIDALKGTDYGDLAFTLDAPTTTIDGAASRNLALTTTQSSILFTAPTNLKEGEGYHYSVGCINANGCTLNFASTYFDSSDAQQIDPIFIENGEGVSLRFVSIDGNSLTADLSNTFDGALTTQTLTESSGATVDWNGADISVLDVAGGSGFYTFGDPQSNLVEGQEYYLKISCSRSFGCAYGFNTPEYRTESGKKVAFAQASGVTNTLKFFAVDSDTLQLVGNLPSDLLDNAELATNGSGSAPFSTSKIFYLQNQSDTTGTLGSSGLGSLKIGEEVQVVLFNDHSADWVVTFDPEYVTSDGGQLVTTVPNAAEHQFTFRYELLDDGAGSSINKLRLITPSYETTVATTKADSRILSANTDLDILLADFEEGEAFHFHTLTSIDLSSAGSGIGTIIDGDALFNPSPVTVPSGTQGYLVKNAAGDVNVVYDVSLDTDYGTLEAVTDAATVSLDGDVSRNYGLTTTQATVAFAAPTNLEAGQVYHYSVGCVNATGCTLSFLNTSYFSASDATPLADYVLASGEGVGIRFVSADGVSLTANLEAPASGLEVVRVDASAAAQNIILPAATGSNDAVIYTLTDKTSVAEVTVQSGEQLNGVVDANFLFSNYEEGTQFLATDRTTGKWDVTVIGESQSVSSRVGEFFYAKSGSTVAGYLPVTAGTVVNGATSYPVWAAMYPEFVVGNDIVFPANVDGMFLRNIGGNAGSEGAFQNDQFQGHGHNIVTNNNIVNNFHIDTNSSKNEDVEGSGSDDDRAYTIDQLAADLDATTPETFSVYGAPRYGTETRTKNRAYQLYTIVDNYNEKTLAGLVTPENLHVASISRIQTTLVDDLQALDIVIGDADVAGGTVLSFSAGDLGINIGSIADDANNQIVIAKDGLYEIDFQASMETGASARAVIQTVKNGTDVLCNALASASSLTYISEASCSALVPLIAGDILTFRGAPDSSTIDLVSFTAKVEQKPSATIVAANAVITLDTAISAVSTNAVENQAIYTALDAKLDDTTYVFNEAARDTQVNTIASSVSSHATDIANNTTAIGNNATAITGKVDATTYSTDQGAQDTAIGNNTTAIGTNTTAIGGKLDTTTYNTDQDAQDITIAANTAARHSHTNKAILDATQESYTTALNTKLDALKESDKGYFATSATLPATGVNGDFAQVGDTDTIWMWDGDTSAWVNTDSTGGAGGTVDTAPDLTSTNPIENGALTEAIANGTFIDCDNSAGTVNDIQLTMPYPIKLRKGMLLTFNNLLASTDTEVDITITNAVIDGDSNQSPKRLTLGDSRNVIPVGTLGAGKRTLIQWNGGTSWNLITPDDSFGTRSPATTNLNYLVSTDQTEMSGMNFSSVTTYKHTIRRMGGLVHHYWEIQGTLAANANFIDLRVRDINGNADLDFESNFNPVVVTVGHRQQFAEGAMEAGSGFTRFDSRARIYPSGAGQWQTGDVTILAHAVYVLRVQ